MHYTETLFIFVQIIKMQRFFSIIILEEANKFLEQLDIKTKEKVLYNIDKASFTMDNELFKKLNKDIWEFRTKYTSKAYRLFSFWDKEEKSFDDGDHQRPGRHQEAGFDLAAAEKDLRNEIAKIPTLEAVA